MRSAEGLATLRDIARRYGPVRIDCVEANAPDEWTVSLVGHFSYEHGSSLEETIGALWDDLERFGPMTVEEANQHGSNK
jgi:hypothetical protein